MATQKRDVQWFSAKVNGENYSFQCYTTWTRNGFCHTVVSWDYGTTDTKVSYLNRTWERFTYESALKRAIDKFPKEMQQALRDQIIEGKAAEEEERCEAEFNRFKELHDGLSQENKDRLAASGIELHDESDVRAVMGLMGLMTLMQQ